NSRVEMISALRPTCSPTRSSSAAIMSFRSLLLVLLHLACIQSFTTATNADTPEPCCFTFHEAKIPLRLITEYKETGRHCANPGI
ncbi:C-C motif chemokine 4, partial [Clarias magur]